MTIRTVTASGVTEVNFNSDGTKPYFYSSEKYCWIKNLSDADMYASLDSACTAGAAGTALISAGECVLIELSPANKVYISGSGNAEIHTRDSAECPFKKPQKGGDVLPKYAGGYSGFIDINRNNSEDMYSRLNSLPFITNTGEDLSLEFCMKVLSGRTHAGRYLDFDNGTFVISDEYSDGHYYLEIKCGGEWRLTESSQIEIPQDVNFTLSVVIGAENTQIFIQKENGDSNFYTYNSLDSSMLDNLTSGGTYFFDSTESNRHVDGKLYAFRKYRRALTQAEITKNHQEDMLLVAMANRLEIIKQPEDVNTIIGETIKLQIEAVGENIDYQWVYKHTEIDTSTINFNDGANATLVKTVDEDFAGIIVNCLITDNSQNVLTSDSVKVSLKSNPNGIEIIDQPDNIITSPGEKITLSVVAVGENLSYQWRYKYPNESYSYWQNFRNGNFSSIQKNIDSDYNNILVHCVVTDVNQNVAISDSIRIVVQDDNNRKSETKLESKGNNHL